MFLGVPGFDAVPLGEPMSREPLPPEVPVDRFEDGVVLCEIPTAFSMGVTNCWLVIGEQDVLCVDPGADAAAAAEHIGEALARYGRTIDAVDTIVVTHTHPDHCGAAAGLAAIADAKVAVGAPEVAALVGHADAPRAVAAVWRGLGAPDDEVDRAVSRCPPYDPVPSSRIEALRDGTRLWAGGRWWNVYVLGGHSPGHVVLAGEGMLISGDHLLANVLPAIHLGPSPLALGHGVSFPNGMPWEPSVHAYLASLERFDQGFDGAAVLPGHGVAFRGAARPVERARRYHRVRCELVEARLAKRGPSTVWDMTLEMYAGLASAGGVDRRFPSAAAEIAGRLEALHRAGRVTCEPRGQALVFGPA
ncbi:MAG: MBL fold metallo-hydrolase [Myxococcota bacterium]